jgi:hypothetical protein
MTLTAIHDLAVSPTRYDFTTFVGLADLHRRQGNLEARPVRAFWSNGSFDIDQKRWRIRNMRAPLCWLSPTCRGVTIRPSATTPRTRSTWSSPDEAVEIADSRLPSGGAMR